MITVIIGCKITVLAEELANTTAKVSGVSTIVSATVGIDTVYALLSGVMVISLLTG